MPEWPEDASMAQLRGSLAGLSGTEEPVLAAIAGHLRATLETLESQILTSYRTAYENAQTAQAAGEPPGMVRSWVLESAIRDLESAIQWGSNPDDYDHPLLRAVHDGIEDALAGRPARTSYAPAWDLTHDEMASLRRKD